LIIKTVRIGFKIYMFVFNRPRSTARKTASFKIYDNSFYCFGCGVGGTVIDFVMKMFSLTDFEAVKKLNIDFRLNLPLSEKITPEEYKRSLQEARKREQDKNLINDFVKWEKRAFKTISNYYKDLKFWGEQIFIHNCGYFNKYLPEVENIVFIEILLDTMIANTNNFEEQIKFYKIYGELVDRIGTHG